ncbi:hypothetical protein [Moraxella sp. Pampa]|uniref:hypothetical protein n=1 Tax=Moraxella sp. Pampa TaxID=3111978 RepID=UPI002B412D60|nr:hypothetical protein [Moraxella sp. Pampa]
MIFSVFVLALLPFTTAFVHVGISICHLLAAWEYYAKFKTTRKYANIVNFCQLFLTKCKIERY